MKKAPTAVRLIGAFIKMRGYYVRLTTISTRILTNFRNLFGHVPPMNIFVARFARHFPPLFLPARAEGKRVKGLSVTYHAES
ncbi:MAG: hypothetical protein ACK496_15350, partial [Acidobacteriota bacterium]